MIGDRRTGESGARDVVAVPIDTRVAFGRYRIDGVIGAGSMGTVYVAYDPLIERQVAIKRAHAHLMDAPRQESLRNRFRQEVRSAARCAHPGIVAILDYVEGEDDQYIVMEHVAGPSLQTVLSDDRMSQPEALEIALQLLSALTHAHLRGVVHRDVKPANVLIGEGSRVKLTDFGVAWTNLDAPVETKIFGTPSYMSPEQARGDMPDVRSDLFSVGMLLLRLLTDTPAYAEVSPFSVFRLLATPDPIDLTGLESPVQAVLARAVAKKPTDRFQTADAFAEALRTLVPPDRPPVDLDALRARRAIAELECDPASDVPAPTVTLQMPSVLSSSEADETMAVSHARATAEAPMLPEVALALPGIAEALAEHVGPIAAVLTARAAPGCASPHALVVALGRAIEDQGTRERFATAARALADPGSVVSPSIVSCLARRSCPRFNRRLGEAAS